MAKANIPKTRTVVIPKASVLWFPTQFREQQLLDNLDHVEREMVRVEIQQSTHLSLETAALSLQHVVSMDRNLRAHVVQELLIKLSIYEAQFI